MTIPTSLVCPYKRSPSTGEIVAIREKMRWTKNDIAKMLGVSVTVPAKWERGDMKMHRGMWELLNIKARVLLKRIGYI